MQEEDLTSEGRRTKENKWETGKRWKMGRLGGTVNGTIDGGKILEGQENNSEVEKGAEGKD